MFDAQRLLNYLYEDKAAVQAYEALEAAGGRVYIVGGAVRDTVLNKKPNDIDLLVTGLDAPRIKKVLGSITDGHVAYAGKNFGVFHFHYRDDTVEIAMPREEESTGPLHTDFDVKYDKDIPVDTDLSRRDFTANAMAFDIDSEQLIDPFKGQHDVLSKSLRLVNPQAFQDDPLRIVRAIVAYSVNGLTPDEYTLQEMENNANRIKSLPGERIRMELDKLLAGVDPAGAFRLAYDTGILDEIVPELAAGYDFDQQNKYHDLNVGDHSLAVLDYISELTTDPDVRLAALMHDIGKPDTFWQDTEGNGHFYGSPEVPGSQDHEERGAQITQEFMERLHYSNDRISKVVNLVQNHMFPYFTSLKGAAKFVARVGDIDSANSLMDIREADSHGKNNGQINTRDQEKIDMGRGLLQKLTQENTVINPQNLPITGHDLIDVGIRPGPQMGDILRSLVDVVQDHPELNNHDALLEYVRENYGE